jgi:hypothetical protein
MINQCTVLFMLQKCYQPDGKINEIGTKHLEAIFFK